MSENPPCVWYLLVSGDVFINLDIHDRSPRNSQPYRSPQLNPPLPRALPSFMTGSLLLLSSSARPRRPPTTPTPEWGEREKASRRRRRLGYKWGLPPCRVPVSFGGDGDRRRFRGTDRERRGEANGTYRFGFWEKTLHLQRRVAKTKFQGGRK